MYIPINLVDSPCEQLTSQYSIIRRDLHQIIFRTGMLRTNIGATHAMFYKILVNNRLLYTGFQRLLVIFWAKYITNAGACVYRYLPFKFAYTVFCCDLNL